jgi:hypothetical protein
MGSPDFGGSTGNNDSCLDMSDGHLHFYIGLPVLGPGCHGLMPIGSLACTPPFLANDFLAHL